MMVTRPLPLSNGFYQEWDMYDDNDQTAFKVVRVGNAAGQRIGVGVYTGSSTTNYAYHNAAYAYTATTVARSVGWHKFGTLLTANGSATFYIDGQAVGTVTAQFSNATVSSVEGYGNSGFTTTYYVDDLRIRGTCGAEATATVGIEEEYDPTAVSLASFTAEPRAGQIRLNWETASEIDIAGFNVYRSDAADGHYSLLNGELIPSQAPGSPQGAVYNWADAEVDPGVAYYYKLEVIDIYGGSTLFGPVSARATYSVYLPLVIR